MKRKKGGMSSPSSYTSHQRVSPLVLHPVKWKLFTRCCRTLNLLISCWQESGQLPTSMGFIYSLEGNFTTILIWNRDDWANHSVTCKTHKQIPIPLFAPFIGYVPRILIGKCQIQSFNNLNFLFYSSSFQLVPNHFSSYWEFHFLPIWP